MNRERAIGTSVTRLHTFEDPDNEVYKKGRAGYSIDELIREFHDRFKRRRVVYGNLFLAEGINTIWIAISGGVFTPFDSANAHIGVGDGTAAPDYAQTGLLGTNKYYKSMDVGYPTFGTDRKATYRSTFGGTDANFAWNEWTVANGNSDAAINMNRKVESLGTKTPGSTWILTVELIIG